LDSSSDFSQYPYKKITARTAVTEDHNTPSASKLCESGKFWAAGGKCREKRRMGFPCSFSSQTEFASVETCLSPLGFRFLCHLQISWQYIFAACAKKEGKNTQQASERKRERKPTLPSSVILSKRIYCN